MTNKSPAVDEFLSALDHPRLADIDTIRTGLLSTDPALSEQIKWNAPSFGYDGQDRVTFRLHPGDRCELIVHRGAKERTDEFSFDDPDELIAWVAGDRGQIIVPEYPSPDECRAIIGLLQRWLHATSDTEPEGAQHE